MSANGEIKREAVFQPEFLEDLDNLCRQTIENEEVVIIDRADGKNVLLISEAELESLLETLYLLRSPKNSARLLTAL
ncbi:MAG: type II toxin-antitoxin system Phd/YefM family antitoxin [Rivularia sp. (in: cyanobacteria)]